MKNNGISLIVLVVTIIVVVILAGAIILAMSGNNPMNNAKIASLASSRESIESGIFNYVSKVKADTLAKYDMSAILTGDSKGASDYRIVEKSGTTFSTTTVTKDDEIITLYKLDKDMFYDKIEKLPDTPSSYSNWYVDKQGKVYLIFDENGQALKWMVNRKKEMDDTTLLSFVAYKNGPLGGGVSGK